MKINITLKQINQIIIGVINWASFKPTRFLKNEIKYIYPQKWAAKNIAILNLQLFILIYYFLGNVLFLFHQILRFNIIAISERDLVFKSMHFTVSVCLCVK